MHIRSYSDGNSFYIDKTVNVDTVWTVNGFFTTRGIATKEMLSQALDCIPKDRNVILLPGFTYDAIDRVTSGFVVETMPGDSLQMHLESCGNPTPTRIVVVLAVVKRGTGENKKVLAEGFNALVSDLKASSYWGDEGNVTSDNDIMVAIHSYGEVDFYTVKASLNFEKVQEVIGAKRVESLFTAGKAASMMDGHMVKVQAEIKTILDKNLYRLYQDDTVASRGILLAHAIKNWFYPLDNSHVVFVNNGYKLGKHATPFHMAFDPTSKSILIEKRITDGLDNLRSDSDTMLEDMVKYLGTIHGSVPAREDNSFHSFLPSATNLSFVAAKATPALPVSLPFEMEMPMNDPSYKFDRTVGYLPVSTVLTSGIEMKTLKPQRLLYKGSKHRMVKPGDVVGGAGSNATVGVTDMTTYYIRSGVDEIEMPLKGPVQALLDMITGMKAEHQLLENLKIDATSVKFNVGHFQ